MREESEWAKLLDDIRLWSCHSDRLQGSAFKLDGTSPSSIGLVCIKPVMLLLPRNWKLMTLITSKFSVAGLEYGV